MLSSFCRIFVMLCLCLYCSTVIADHADKATSNIKIKTRITGVDSIELSESLKKSLPITGYARKQINTINQVNLLSYEGISILKENLEVFGYYQSNVNVSIEPNKKERDAYIVTYSISLGKPVVITDIEIHVTKNDASLFQKINKNKKILIDKILTQDRYNTLKDGIKDVALQYGYFDIRIIQARIHINTNKTTAHIFFDVSLGARYTINKIIVNQDRYTYNDKLINGYVTLKTGQYYSAEDVDQTRKNFKQSSHFVTASIVPQIYKLNRKNHTIDINIALVSEYKAKYSAGIGYSSFSGPLLSASIIASHLNDIGYQAEASVDASPNNTEFLIALNMPVLSQFMGRDAIYAKQSYISTNPYRLRLTTLGISKEKKLSNKLSLNVSLGFYNTSYLQKNFNTTQEGSYLVPTLKLSLNEMSNPGLSGQGFQLNNITQASYNNLLSDASFFRNMTQFLYSYPIIYNQNRFIFYGVLGGLITDDFDSIAPNFRFYAGGVSTLLGYDYMSQGYKIGNQVIGGKYLAAARVSFQQKLYGNISALLLYNLGNASNEIDFGDVPILQAAGIGFSYKMNLGGINIYLMRTINDKPNRWKFDFSIGFNI